MYCYVIAQLIIFSHRFLFLVLERGEDFVIEEGKNTFSKRASETWCHVMWLKCSLLQK